MKNHVYAYTTVLTGEDLLIKTDVDVFFGSKLDLHNAKRKTYKALWDTGACWTSLSKEYIKELGLEKKRTARAYTVNGIVDVDTYIANIMLPGNIFMQEVEILELVSDCGASMLIGMDIIRHGDFSITNTNSATTFSFRIPSVAEIDYVQESNS